MITTDPPSRRALFRTAPTERGGTTGDIDAAIATPADGSGNVELGYRPALDGLRAVAVIAVLFFHARFSWAKGGFLGVSTFFTLSGFLITTLLIAEHRRSGSISLRAFWTRRFRRLLPAAWLTIAAIVAGGAVGAWNDDQLRALRGDVPAAFLQVINWHFVLGGRSYGDQFAAPSPLEHYWSLAIEEQFYVVFPLAALLALRWAKGRRWPLAAGMAAVATVSVVVSGITARHSTARAYFGTDTRLMELCVGVILAVALSGRWTATAPRLRNWAVAPGLVAVVVSVWSWAHFTVEDRALYPWGLLLTAACSMALITAALQPGLVSSALSVAPLRWVGRISYGIYLIHWPVFLWLNPTRTGLGAWSLFVVRMTVTVLLAMLSHRLVENPIRLRERLTGPIRGIVIPSFVGGVLIVLVLVTADLPAVRELDRASASGPIVAVVPPTRVLIIGDRLAASLGAGLTDVDSSRFTIQVDADPFCGVVNGGFVSLPDGTVEFDSARCRGVRERRQATEASFRPDVVLVWSGLRDVANRRLSNNEPWGQPGVADVDDLLRTEVAATVEGMAKGGAAVMWMTMPIVADTEVPPAPPAPAPGEPGHGLYQELQLQGARQDAPPAAFVQNDPARVGYWNSLVTKEVVARGGRMLQASTLLDHWSDAAGVGPADTTVRAGGVGVTAQGAHALLDWMGDILRGAHRSSVATAAPSPGSAGAVDQALPPAPPVTPRRVVPAGGTVRTLIVGDSVGVNLAFGLRDWQEASRSPVAVYSAAQLGCAIARGGSYRFLNEVNKLTDRCDWAAPTSWAAHLSEATPDVVVMCSGIWEVADRLLPGDSRWRHVGDPVFDHYLMSEWLSAIDFISSQGATVMIVTYPHFQAGRDQGFTDLPESDPARVDRLNQLIRQIAALRPGIVGVVDFQGWLAQQPGAELDDAKRDDGLHFKDTYLPTIGGWLGPQLEVVGRAGIPPAG